LFKRFAFWLTLFGIAISLFNMTGLDRDNLMLFTFSAPVWFIELFRDVHTVNAAVIYLLTIGSWFVLGLIVDRFLYGSRKVK
jgi:hypothetical protein